MRFPHRRSCVAAFNLSSKFTYEDEETFWIVEDTYCARKSCLRTRRETRRWKIQLEEKISSSYQHITEAINIWEGQTEQVGTFIGLGAGPIYEKCPEVGDVGEINFNWAEFIFGWPGVSFYRKSDENFKASMKNAGLMKEWTKQNSDHKKNLQRLQTSKIRFRAESDEVEGPSSRLAIALAIVSLTMSCQFTT